MPRSSAPRLTPRTWRRRRLLEDARPGDEFAPGGGRRGPPSARPHDRGLARWIGSSSPVERHPRALRRPAAEVVPPALRHGRLAAAALRWDGPGDAQGMRVTRNSSAVRPRGARPPCPRRVHVHHPLGHAVGIADLAFVADRAATLRSNGRVVSTADVAVRSPHDPQLADGPRLEPLLFEQLGVGEGIAGVGIDGADRGLTGGQVVGMAGVDEVPIVARVTGSSTRSGGTCRMTRLMSRRSSRLPAARRRGARGSGRRSPRPRPPRHAAHVGGWPPCRRGTPNGRIRRRRRWWRCST